MTDTISNQVEDKFEHASANAKAWYENIKEVVGFLQSRDENVSEAARTEIQESPLSVQVRGGWRAVNQDESSPDEFEILLSTGGPALRIWGQLNEHSEPTDCELQMQDWGTPWTKWAPEPYDETFHDTLLAYASCFYFGD